MTLHTTTQFYDTPHYPNYPGVTRRNRMCVFENIADNVVLVSEVVAVNLYIVAITSVVL